MNRELMIKYFAQLGTLMQYFLEKEEKIALFQRAEAENPWFSLESTETAWKAWAELLKEESLIQWLEPYPVISEPKRVGVVCAGNIPLVGMHDLVSVLITGHRLKIKLSSKDSILMQWVIDELWAMDDYFKQNIQVAERLHDIDAAIATGSNNTARYFKQYFEQMPSIIRKNRTSVAALSGDETEAQWMALGEDIFTYFGLGCRNVTALMVPNGFDVRRLLTLWEQEFASIVNHNKYANNYFYQRAVKLLNQETFLEASYCLMQEHSDLFSPLSVIHYQYYTDVSSLERFLLEKEENIQVLATEMNLDFPRKCPLGNAQKPNLFDYADGVDVMEFLNEI